MGENLIEGELEAGGRTRTFRIRPPRDRDAPLVLMLHGNMSDLDDQTRLQVRDHTVQSTGFAAHADEWGIAVAYPDGWGGCWADGRGATTADDAGVDDVAFLRGLIEWSAEHFGTRPDHTVVAGMSNGASMSHHLALAAADLVAVFAAVAGALPAALAEARPTHAVSALLINGDGDLMQPITGGYSRHRGPNGELRGRTLSLVESAERWATIDRCAGDGATTSTETTRRHTVSGGVGGTRVAAWTVLGGGHTWPGSPLPAEWATRPGLGVTMEFEASEEIWRFAQPLLFSADTRTL